MTDHAWNPGPAHRDPRSDDTPSNRAIHRHAVRARRILAHNGNPDLRLGRRGPHWHGPNLCRTAADTERRSVIADDGLFALPAPHHDEPLAIYAGWGFGVDSSVMS